MTDTTRAAHEALRDCPFCGDNDVMVIFDDVPKVYEIECGVCSARVQAMTEAEVIAAWNTRTSTRMEARYYKAATGEPTAAIGPGGEPSK